MRQQRKSAQSDILTLLKPASGWPLGDLKKNIRYDLGAGVIGAILALPQAIALATLAGMPPQYGIYASIIPVVIALVWGSSWFTLSGPNTAVSVMLAATILPFAALGSGRFIELVFLLSLFVGIIQLIIGFFKLGVILDFISSTVILAVTQAVAIILVVSAIFSISLPELSSGSGVYTKAQLLINNIADVNLGTLLVGGVTILFGFFAKLFLPRYYLLIAMIAGSITAAYLNSANLLFANNIPLLDSVPLTLNPWVIPVLDQNSLTLVIGEWENAIAIAFLGLMQTVIISRSFVEKTGKPINTNREIIGQGLANTIAPFTSAFAGSGSFNRSATNYQAGAKSPLAGIFSVLLLIVIVLLGQQFLGMIPKSVIAATLFLVGLGLFDFSDIRRIFNSFAERWIFILAFSSCLILGLNTGVLVGVFAALIVYLWRTSQPNLTTSQYISRNGKSVKVLEIDGNLFFGSVPETETYLFELMLQDSSTELLLIKIDHLSYIDIPGGRLILKMLSDSLNKDLEAYAYVSNRNVLDTLKKAGLGEEVSEDVIIIKNQTHPMTSILYPYRSKGGTQMTAITDTGSLLEYLSKSALLSNIPSTKLSSLLENNPPRFAEAGEIIVTRNQEINEHLFLIDGEIEAQRIWSVSGKNDKSYTWNLEPNNDAPALLTAASNNLRVRAVSDIQYVLLNADKIDALLGWTNRSKQDKNKSNKIQLVQQIAITHHLPQSIMDKIVNELVAVEVEAGEVIIKEADKGDSYYMIEDGEAEVIRSDPFTGETSVVNQIGTGDCFGEEALIQDGFRNATIRMLTPGKLQVLSRKAFEKHIQSSLLNEISAEEAYQKINNKEVKLLDCRYDMEYEDCRIENAFLIPLHELREQTHQLKQDIHYLVYCRSGRRSKAAAYLLQERNFQATSIKGGIKDWPYEILYGEE